MQELPFLHSAHRLMLVDICMKFHDASIVWFKNYRADTMETRFCEGQSSKGNNSKTINARVTVLALCTLPNAG